MERGAAAATALRRPAAPGAAGGGDGGEGTAVGGRGPAGSSRVEVARPWTPGVLAAGGGRRSPSGRRAAAGTVAAGGGDGRGAEAPGAGTRGRAQPWTPAPVAAEDGVGDRRADLAPVGDAAPRGQGPSPGGRGWDSPAAPVARGAEVAGWAAAVPAGDGARARRRARRWLERARRAATAHLERARREADDLRRRAWQEGFARGEAEGRARWEAAQRRLEEQVASQRRDLEARYRRLLAASAEPLLELALAIARRVAGQQLAADPTALRAQVEEALARLGAEGARVLLHPESLAQLEGTAPLAPGVELVGDLTLAPGDFRVESPRGQVDGRVAAQVDRLGRVLREQGLGAVPPVEGDGLTGPGAGGEAQEPGSGAASPHEAAAPGGGPGPVGASAPGADLRPAAVPPAAARTPGGAEGRDPA